jgi:hypothetical protein
MAKLIASRTAQWPLVAEFTFNFDDTMVTTTGTTVDFGKVSLAGVVDIIPLPPGATVISGEVIVTTAFDTAGFDITVGDSGSAARYLGSTDVKGLGRTALVPTGYKGTGENIRLTFASDDVCTTGKATIRVMYTVENRANEVQIA